MKVAFIGMTLEGTPTIVTPAGVAGLDFHDEAETVNALVPKLRSGRASDAIVVLIHQGGQQSPPYANGYQDVNGCENLTGAIVADRQRLDAGRSTSSSPATRTRLQLPRSTASS